MEKEMRKRKREREVAYAPVHSYVCAAQLELEFGTEFTSLT